MVRDTLGEDAVIVATQEERNGAIHVTAAVEPHFDLSKQSAHDDWLQYDDEDEESAVAEELTEAMLRHSVSEDVMDHIISCATVVGLEEPDTAMIAAVEHLFNFKPLPNHKNKAPQMFVGVPGSGKTLAVAKMAARAVMNDLKPIVISCDTVRAGGIEQLEAFTKLLKVDLLRADNAADLQAQLADLDGYDQILIDTPGVNPFDKDDLKTVARLYGAAQIKGHLILPAGGDADEASETARAFSTIGIDSLVPTRLDIARRLGGILTAAHHGNLSFADASNTPKVADGLFALTPHDLARMLMPSAFQSLSGRSSPTKSARSGRQ